MDAPLIGIDLVEPDRLGERLDRTPTLLQELFHPGEVAYSADQPHPIQCLAARFAVKEAVHKCLGMHGFDPLDVEVVSGGPHTRVKLHGAVADRARALDVTVSISISHLPAMAAATALGRPNGGGEPDEPTQP